MQITIMFKLFSNLIPIRKNLSLNLNKGFIELPCTITNWIQTILQICNLRILVSQRPTRYSLVQLLTTLLPKESTTGAKLAIF